MNTFTFIRWCDIQAHMVMMWWYYRLGVQVLLLVRDPRGTMQSRRHRVWCPDNPDCNDPAWLCQDLISDFHTAKKFLKMFPHSFRYVYNISLCIVLLIFPRSTIMRKYIYCTLYVALKLAFLSINQRSLWLM